MSGVEALIHPNVSLPEVRELGAFVIVGQPPRGKETGEITTQFGIGATLRSHTVVYAGNVIGARFQTGHGVSIRELNTIGDDVSVGTGTVIEHHVKIGNAVRIH